MLKDRKSLIREKVCIWIISDLAGEHTQSISFSDWTFQYFLRMKKEKPRICPVMTVKTITIRY